MQCDYNITALCPYPDSGSESKGFLQSRNSHVVDEDCDWNESSGDGDDKDCSLIILMFVTMIKFVNLILILLLLMIMAVKRAIESGRNSFVFHYSCVSLCILCFCSSTAVVGIC